MENTETRIIKLALYGDSLACPRIGIVDSHERYIALIEEYIRRNFKTSYLEIRDRAMGGATISDLYKTFCEDNGYYKLPANYLILHAGVVDCAPRPLEEHYKEKINKLPSFIRKLAIRYIHNNRSRLIRKNGGGFVKTSPGKFKNDLNKILEEALPNYDSVFIINICPTNAKIEKHSPGFGSNIKKYNDLINEVIEKSNSNKVMLIDIYSEISVKGEIDEYIVKEDGHHILPGAHRIIANKIISYLNG